MLTSWTHQSLRQVLVRLLSEQQLEKEANSLPVSFFAKRTLAKCAIHFYPKLNHQQQNKCRHHGYDGTLTSFIYGCVANGSHPELSEEESCQWSSITSLHCVGGAGCVACPLEVMARGPLSLQSRKYGVISICVSISATVAEEAQTYLVCSVWEAHRRDNCWAETVRSSRLSSAHCLWAFYTPSGWIAPWKQGLHWFIADP